MSSLPMKMSLNKIVILVHNNAKATIKLFYYASSNDINILKKSEISK